MNVARDHHNRIIHRVIKVIYALYMHIHTNDEVISQSNSIANNKILLFAILLTCIKRIDYLYNTINRPFAHHNVN